MGLYINENQTPDEKHWSAVFIRGVWNCVDTGNVTIFKVVKNFSCWTVVVSIVLTVCKIAHKHSLGYYVYISPLVHMFALMLVSSRCLVLCISVMLTEFSNWQNVWKT